MFQFTTTNVINTLDWHEGVDNLIQKTADGAALIKGVGVFRPENVLAAYKATAIDRELALLAIDMAKVKTAADAVIAAKGGDKKEIAEGDVLRLQLYIGLDLASQESLYSNDMYYKGRPWSIEFVWKGNDTAKSLESLIKKYQVNVVYQKLLDVKADGNTLTISATDEYQRFRKAVVELYDDTFTTHTPAGEYKVIADIAVKDSAIELKQEGAEGFCTSRWLAHNVRIPTASRTHFASISQREAPIPGATYTQYTIHYCTNRGILGTNAVGDMVRSLTTHVFYVLDSLKGTDGNNKFETALNEAGITFAEVSAAKQTAEAKPLVVEPVKDFDDKTKVTTAKKA